MSVRPSLGPSVGKAFFKHPKYDRASVRDCRKWSETVYGDLKSFLSLKSSVPSPKYIRWTHLWSDFLCSSINVQSHSKVQMKSILSKLTKKKLDVSITFRLLYYTALKLINMFLNIGCPQKTLFCLTKRFHLFKNLIFGSSITKQTTFENCFMGQRHVFLGGTVDTLYLLVHLCGLLWFRVKL